MKYISNRAWTVILMIATAITTYVVNYNINKSNQSEFNRVRTFDQFVNIRQVDYTQLEQEKFKIFYDNKPVHGYNDIKVILYNYDDKVFNDVKVYITLKPQAGDTLKLIAATINGDKEIITPLKDSLSPDKGAIEFGYLIKIANPTNVYNTPIFDLNIQVSSSKPPISPLVRLYCPGLNSIPETQEHTWQRFTKMHQGFFDSDIVEFVEFIGLFIIALAIIAILFTKIVTLFPTPTRDKKELDEHNKLIGEVAIKINNGEIDPTDYKKVINAYFKAENELDYNTTSKFVRWMNNLTPPK